MERTAGIEPAALAWKAKVLPLYDVRAFYQISLYKNGGGRWIRTTEGGAVRFTV